MKPVLAMIAMRAALVLIVIVLGSLVITWALTGCTYITITDSDHVSLERKSSASIELHPRSTNPKGEPSDEGND